MRIVIEHKTNELDAALELSKFINFLDVPDYFRGMSAELRNVSMGVGRDQNLAAKGDDCRTVDDSYVFTVKVRRALFFAKYEAHERDIKNEFRLGKTPINMDDLMAGLRREGLDNPEPTRAAKAQNPPAVAWPSNFRCGLCGSVLEYRPVQGLGPVVICAETHCPEYRVAYRVPRSAAIVLEKV